MASVAPAKGFQKKVPAIYYSVPDYPGGKNANRTCDAKLRKGFVFVMGDTVKEGPDVVGVDRTTAYLQRQKWDNYAEVMEFFGFPTHSELDPVALQEKMLERLRAQTPKPRDTVKETIEALMPAMAEVFGDALAKALDRMRETPNGPGGPAPVAPGGPKPFQPGGPAGIRKAPATEKA